MLNLAVPFTVSTSHSTRKWSIRPETQPQHVSVYWKPGQSVSDVHVISCRALSVDSTCRCLATYRRTLWDPSSAPASVRPARSEPVYMSLNATPTLCGRPGPARRGSQGPLSLKSGVSSSVLWATVSLVLSLISICWVEECDVSCFVYFISICNRFSVIGGNVMYCVSGKWKTSRGVLSLHWIVTSFCLFVDISVVFKE